MENTCHKRTVQKYYSERATDYDRQKVRTWKSEQGFGTEILNEVVDASTGLESKPLLEVGVGSGRIGLPLLKKVKPWFVGLDVSREMLELARARMSSCKQNFDLILGDAEHLPFIKKGFRCDNLRQHNALLRVSRKELDRVFKNVKRKGCFCIW